MKNLPAHPFFSNYPSLLLLAFFGLLTPSSPAEEQGWETCIAKGRYLNAFYESKPGVGGRHYERDRRIDVKHLKLELEPDFKKQAMSGVLCRCGSHQKIIEAVQAAEMKGE